MGAAAIKLSAGLVIPFLVLRRGAGAAAAARGRRRRRRCRSSRSRSSAFPDHALGMLGKLQRQGALVDIASVPLGAAYALGLPRVVPRRCRSCTCCWRRGWPAGWSTWRAAGTRWRPRAGRCSASSSRRRWLLPWYLVWPLGARRRGGPPAAAGGHLRGRRLLRDRPRAAGMTASLPRRRASPSCFQRRLARATAACSISLAALLLACVPAKAPATPESLVNPFIGTQDYGNTFPGAALPFGMVQLSPDNGGQAGYDHDNTRIDGFSHTHLSGVGCGALGEVRVMPTTGAVASDRPARFGSHYRHAPRRRAPATTASTSRKYGDPGGADGHRRGPAGTATRFPSTGRANVLFDVGRANMPVYSSAVDVTSDRTLEGSVEAGGFCGAPRPPPRLLLRALRPPVRGDRDVAARPTDAPAAATAPARADPTAPG